MGVKREIPEPLKAILKWDIVATNKFVKTIDQNYGPLQKHEKAMKSLEISCHGIPWLIASAILIFLATGDFIRQWSVNVFLALIFDIVIVAIIKAIARRRRPSDNNDDMLATFSVDKFSFPSGHATRATMFAILFPLQYDMFLPFTLVLVVWSASICISRILLKRHHLLDVVGGVCIGILEGVIFSSFIWLSTENSRSIVGYFLDEVQAGASYDV